MKLRIRSLIIAVSSLIFLASCSDASTVDVDEDATDAVRYITRGVAAGDYRKRDTTTFMWTKTAPDTLSFGRESAPPSQRWVVRNETECVFNVESYATAVGKPEELLGRFTIDFTTFAGVENFNFTDTRVLSDGVEIKTASWTLIFGDQCAVRKHPNSGAGQASEECAMTFQARSDFVKEERLSAAVSFFRNQKCAGQKF